MCSPQDSAPRFRRGIGMARSILPTGQLPSRERIRTRSYNSEQNIASEKLQYSPQSPNSDRSVGTDRSATQQRASVLRQATSRNLRELRPSSPARSKGYQYPNRQSQRCAHETLRQLRASGPPTGEVAVRYRRLRRQRSSNTRLQLAMVRLRGRHHEPAAPRHSSRPPDLRFAVPPRSDAGTNQSGLCQSRLHHVKHRQKNRSLPPGSTPRTGHTRGRSLLRTAFRQGESSQRFDWRTHTMTT